LDASKGLLGLQHKWAANGLWLAALQPNCAGVWRFVLQLPQLSECLSSLIPPTTLAACGEDAFDVCGVLPTTCHNAPLGSSTQLSWRHCWLVLQQLFACLALGNKAF
jgi:hypothetical protein